MRENIYYWKADSPHSVDEKRQSYFKEKYDRAGLVDLVQSTCRDVLGKSPDEIKPLRADGNHFAFIITLDQKQYFFRADDGAGDDDYLLAESKLMQLAAEAGVPVPKVFHTDISRTVCPFRFQIMEFRAEPCLNVYYKDGTLNVAAIATQLGEHLKRIHSIPLDGFGFMDTTFLQKAGRLSGLSATYLDYFNTRLDDHLGYLRQLDLLSADDERAIRAAFALHEPRLRPKQGVLVHRDLALWNVLGTPDRVTAIIDWDDAVSGDPADDLGMLHCFYEEDFINHVLYGYFGDQPPSHDFHCRIWLHTLRNMLWKTMLRHALGYFDKPGDFFLHTQGAQSLRSYTLQKLQRALAEVQKCERP